MFLTRPLILKLAVAIIMNIVNEIMLMRNTLSGIFTKLFLQERFLDA